MSKPHSRNPSADAVPSGLNEFREYFRRASKALVLFQQPEDILDALPMSQFRCLMDVHHNRGSKMADVAASLGIGVSALSQLVDRLVKRGLVERTPDAGDRRIVRLQPSAAADAILKRHFEAIGQRMSATAEKLGPGSLPDVIEGLRLLAVAAEAVELETTDEAPLSESAAFLSKLPYLRP